MEIVPGLHRLLGLPFYGVNAYLWLPPDGGGPMLFDCGWPWTGKALNAGLRRLGCMPEDLRAIVITHDDVDHSGRLAQLASVSRATVYAHEAEIRRLEHDAWRPVPGISGPIDVIGVAAWAIYSRYPHRPVHGARPLAEGDELPGGWVTLHTPGHTPGHASYFHPKHGVLIAGDALGPALVGRVRAPQPAYSEDHPMAKRTIQKLAGLEPKIICCGHGPIIRDGSASLRRLAGAASAV